MRRAGVKQITRTETSATNVRCRPDEVCDPGEDVAGPLQCPLDCGAACVDGQTGCVRSADGTPAQGTARGRYRENIAHQGSAVVIAQPANEVEFQGRCVDEASGRRRRCWRYRRRGGGQSPVCGNGIVEAGEICDDGDDDNGDGCRNDCTECGPERPPALLATLKGYGAVAGEWVESPVREATFAKTALVVHRIAKTAMHAVATAMGRSARAVVDGQWTARSL